MTDSTRLPGSEAPTRRDFEIWHRFQPTERELLWKELVEAREARRRPTGWAGIFAVGPAAVTALVLAVVFGSYHLAAGFLLLAVIVEIVRQWRLARTIRDLWRALQDPMDGS